MRYLFEVENKDSKGREMPETDLTVFDSEGEAVEYYFNWYRKHGYPMVDISDYDPRKELAELVAFDETTIEHNGVLDQSMVGCGFLWAFFPHWIDVTTFNDGSLSENWENDKKLRELIRKTYRFCMLHEGGRWSVNRIRQNAKVYCSKQSVSNFRPSVAKYLCNAFGDWGSVYDPCVVVDDLTPQQIKALRLADNKTNELADWDIGELDLELADLLDMDMERFGFELPQLDEPTEVVEDEIPEEVETRCKLGDIWKLGNHRLMCGDSTDRASVERLMGGVKADMVFTDSPYGINAVGDNGEVGADFGVAKKGKYKKIIADDTTETAKLAYDIYSQICDKMVLWGGNYFLDFLPASDGWLIWDKRGESGIRNTFADGEMAWCSFHTPIRIYHQLWNGMIREGEHEKRLHPTQKPIKMLGEILKDFTKEGDIILDVFGGSGSTLIACEQLNRKCYMMELDPHYCDVIISRWENLTGQKAELIGGVSEAE